MQKKYWLLLIFLNIYTSFASGNKIETFYGSEETDDPTISQLLTSKTLQRLKGVDQSGALAYWGYVPKFSRYEHSVGVWALLKRFHFPVKQQVAGLLHDSSHTVFSHVADYLFKMPEDKHSYQDSIHLQYLKNRGILAEINKTLKISLKDLNPDSPQYRGLEQDLPDLCADRIEYILHTALVFNKITQKEVASIIHDLRFMDGNWYFINKDSAKRLADFSLEFTEHLWASPWNLAFNYLFNEILEQALELNLITSQDIHYGTDEIVLDKIKNSSSSRIQAKLKKLNNIDRSFKIVHFHYDTQFTPKFRGVDPYIQTVDGLMRLSELNTSYKKRFLNLKNKLQAGIKIVFL